MRISVILQLRFSRLTFSARSSGFSPVALGNTGLIRVAARIIRRKRGAEAPHPFPFHVLALVIFSDLYKARAAGGSGSSPSGSSSTSGAYGVRISGGRAGDINNHVFSSSSPAT